MQHQTPYSKVIEAEVVEEVRANGMHQQQQAQTRTAAAEEETFNLRSTLIMGGMVAVLIAGVYAAHKSGIEARAIQNVGIEQDYRLSLNEAAPESLMQTAAFPSVSRGYYQPARATTIAQVPDMSASLARLNEIVERRRALNEVEFQMMRQQLATEGHQLSETQTRELLLAAGYRPPPRLPAEEKAKAQQKESDAEMARYVANELIKDEIQGFLKKIQIIATVGGHFVDNE